MRLSIILPTLNRPGVLASWLADLSRQTARPHEVIVVLDRAAEWPAYNRTDCTFVRSDGYGVVAGLNTGLRHATGTHVYCSADDDYPMPNLVEHVTSAAIRSSWRLVPICCGAHWRDLGTGAEWRTGTGLRPWGPGFYAPDELVKHSRDGRVFLASHSTVWPRELLPGFCPDLHWHCDWWAVHEPALYAGIIYSDVPIVRVNLSPSSYYGAGYRSREHRRVVARIAQSATPRMLAGGFLAEFGLPMLVHCLMHGRRDIIKTGRFLPKVLRRSAEQLGRRYLPGKIACHLASKIRK